jgi:hypothetical protein
MTHPDDNGRDDAGQSRRDSTGGTSSEASSEGSSGSDLPLDEESAWREIVAHYGERAQLTTTDPDPAVPEAADVSRTNPFDRAYRDAQRPPQQDAWAEEGHFVPPEPPPVPRATPARRLAWLGLFGAPAVMLVAVVLGWTFATWLVVVLVAGFVGGFVFLVATMPRERDEWSGDDGAVL